MQESTGGTKYFILTTDMKNYIYPLLLAVFLVFYKKMDVGIDYVYDPRLIVFFVSVIAYFLAILFLKKHANQWIRGFGFLIVYSVLWFLLIMMPLLFISVLGLSNQTYIIKLFNSLSFARFYFFETLIIASIVYVFILSNLFKK